MFKKSKFPCHFFYKICRTNVCLFKLRNKDIHAGYPLTANMVLKFTQIVLILSHWDTNGHAVDIFQITGIANMGRTTSVLVHGSNKLVLEEAERSIHDALCVIRCLVKKRSVHLVSPQFTHE